MNITTLSAADVHRLLDMPGCIEAIAQTQIALSRGEIRIPLRTAVPLEADRQLLVMPGAAGPALGAKLLTVFPDNTPPSPAIQGAVVLFDAVTGAVNALIDAAAITAIRTAAASAVATRALANPDAATLALLGYGVQAESHLAAISAVRELKEVRVWGPDPSRAAAFAHRLADATPARLVAAATARDAVHDAQIVCTVTGAREPVLEGRWLAPGAHVNLVGAHTADTREADAETLRIARVFTEISSFALAEAGDLLLAIKEGVLTESDIAGEIGAVLDGTLEGRTGMEEITLYKSLGNVAQDLAAAGYVLNRL